jgi:hypothetical protein
MATPPEQIELVSIPTRTTPTTRRTDTTRGALEVTHGAADTFFPRRLLMSVIMVTINVCSGIVIMLMPIVVVPYCV